MPEQQSSDISFLKAAQLFEQSLPGYVEDLKQAGIADPVLLARVLLHYAYSVIREVSGTQALVDTLAQHLGQLRADLSASAGQAGDPAAP